MDETAILLTPGIQSRISLKATPGKPQGAWGFLIACDLFLAALGSGVFVMAVLGDWAGLAVASPPIGSSGEWLIDWAKIPLFWGPFASAVGGCLVILHLGRNWYRVPTAAMNPRTSWMSRGIVIMGAFIALGCFVALIAVLFPSWPIRWEAAWRLLQAAGLLLGLGTIIYTGMLLYSLKYVAFWQSPLLPVLFLSSALAMGAMGLTFGVGIYGLVVSESALGKELIRSMTIVQTVMICLQACVLTGYLLDIKRRGKPEGLISVRMWISGSWRLGFWGGVVGLALALPLVLDLVTLGMDSTLLVMAGAAAGIAGGFILRLGVLSAGIKAMTPLYKYGEWRAQHPVLGDRAMTVVTPVAGHSGETNGR